MNIRCLVLVGVAGLMPAAAMGALYDKDIFCGKTKIGNMAIDTYEKYTGNGGFESKYWLGGSTIGGAFTKDFDADYHFIQSITAYDYDALRWVNDSSVALKAPFIDTAPKGYGAESFYQEGKWDSKQAFDDAPYYDEVDDKGKSKELPKFYDQPKQWLMAAHDSKTGSASMLFETWLVGTVKQTYTQNDKASDDTFRVAPLLGFVWGFTANYKDDGDGKLQFDKDFTVELLKFEWKETPTDAWKGALTYKYGGKGQDNFNVELGDRTEIVPTPATAALLGLGALAWARRRRS